MYNSKLKLLIGCLILIFCFIPIKAFGKNIASTKIIEVKDISITVKQFDKYNLPIKVIVKYSNNTVGTAPVRWNVLKAATDKVGVFNYYGNISGYAKYARLTVNVISQIRKIEDLNITIQTNSDFKLPEKVNAKYSDNQEKEVNVSWEQSKVATDKIGIYTFNGKVIGYDKKVKLNLKVVNIIAKIDDINVTLKQKQEFNAPSKVSVLLIDGTNSEADVLWDKNSIDTGNVGDFVCTGKVIGYEGVVQLKISVVPTIDSIKNENVSFLLGDEYQIPKTVQAKMSDGSVKDVSVIWNPSTIDQTKKGNYKLIGRVDGYDKDIVYEVNIKSAYVPVQTVVPIPSLGFLEVDFSKNFGSCVDASKIEIRCSDGITTHIVKAEGGWNPKTKNRVLLYTTMKFEATKTYTLFIPKGILVAADGDVADEDVILPFEKQ